MDREYDGPPAILPEFTHWIGDEGIRTRKQQQKMERD
jgi:hypothetical protein